MHPSHHRWLLINVSLGVLSLAVGIAALVRIRQAGVAQIQLSAELDQALADLESERAASDALVEQNQELRKDIDRTRADSGSPETAQIPRSEIRIPPRPTSRRTSRPASPSSRPEAGDVLPPEWPGGLKPKTKPGAAPSLKDPDLRICVEDLRWVPKPNNSSVECLLVVLSVTNLTNNTKYVSSASLIGIKGNRYSEETSCLSSGLSKGTRQVGAHDYVRVTLGFEAPRAIGYVLEVGGEKFKVN